MCSTTSSLVFAAASVLSTYVLASRKRSEVESKEAARKTVLVTGGAGYIGSHTCVQLVEAGWHVVIVDSLVNSSQASVERIRELSGVPSAVEFHKIDLLEEAKLDAVIAKSKPVAVIHFAGLKAVGESVDKPLYYYHNNLTGTFNLLKSMLKHKCHQIVFSSSATVYGDVNEAPLTEDSVVGMGITNPYGQTKFMIERVLADTHKANPQLSVVVLRYFNPVGAHKSGRIGEDPQGKPNNLMPFVQQVAVGRREKLTIFGSDWNTKDGTAERDYIHVVDLAGGHLAALRWIDRNSGGYETFNLGTGKSTSVLQVVKNFEKASGREVKYVVGPRRDGDLEALWADTKKAEKELGWTAKFDMDRMCEDGWRWQSSNPMGYSS